MAWETIPAPNYAAFDNSNVVGNALGNLVSNYQQAQQGQQRTQANDLRNQQDKMLLAQSKAFASGLPMNPDGTPNYSAIMKTLAEKGDINAVGSLAPIIQEQQNIQGANAPDSILGGGAAPAGGTDPVSTVVSAESGGKNVPQAITDVNTEKGTPAQGFFQIIDPTWKKYAPEAGVDLAKYPSAIDAPYAVQAAVAQKIPINQWGPRTVAALNAKFRGLNANETLGEAEAQYGGGTQVASLDPSDASAYANSPDQPSIPPVSAAAGSSIPRANAATAVGAVGGAQPQPSPVPQQLAQNNPAWAGIDAALPTGGPGMGFPALGATSSPSPGTPPQANLGGTAAFNPGLPKSTTANGPVGAAPQVASAAPAPQAPASPSQGSVASIASSAGIPPNIAANIARAVGVAPDAPLNPQQAAKAQTIIQNYVARARQQNGQQQTATGGQGQPQGGGPIIPQFPLPNGIKDPQQAILAIDQDIARLSRFGPAANGRIRALEDMRDRIAKSSAPIEMHAGTEIVDPRTRQVLAQTNPSSATNLALQRFLSENPDASAEQIQQFMQAGRGGARSGIGMYMQRFLQENPNATAEEVAKAAQDFQSAGSALTRFTSGTQGNSIRSFNVLVDHLGTLGDAAAALKNGNMQVFNRIAQGVAQQTGSAAPTNFDGTKRIVANELVKAITGGGGALGDRDEIDATVDKANSPEQLAGVIDQYKKLALGQLRGLSRQYSEATGRDDFDRFLAPGTKAFFGDKGEEKKQGGDSGAQNGGLPAGWSVEVH